MLGCDVAVTLVSAVSGTMVIGCTSVVDGVAAVMVPAPAWPEKAMLSPKVSCHGVDERIGEREADGAGADERVVVGVDGGDVEGLRRALEHERRRAAPALRDGQARGGGDGDRDLVDELALAVEELHLGLAGRGRLHLDVRGRSSRRG